MDIINFNALQLRMWLISTWLNSGGILQNIKTGQCHIIGRERRLISKDNL